MLVLGVKGVFIAKIPPYHPKRMVFTTNKKYPLKFLAITL
ncbi:hypothetical protein HMPREF1422_01008 [Helicobacter pylori GAM268Bii]|nr:hypothetical protein HMPREF1416_00738 [Helicobacter pylori GAM260ASi]EMH29394.1 hypothetical protein HMPREF1422_01008 [Helicobacter pylori GAM268Bii]